MLEVSSLVGLLVLHVLILLKEIMELMIEVNLCVLHGHEYLQLFFKAKHSLVSHVLFLNEHADVVGKGLDITVSPVFINRDSNAVDSQLVRSFRLSNQTELLLNVSTRPAEDLHLLTGCQVPEFTALLKEHVEEVLSLLDDKVLSLA